MKTMRKFMSLVLGVALMLGILIVPNCESKAAGTYSFSGMAHVQTYGDKAGTWDGTTLKLGTTGQSKRLESVTIHFVNQTGYSGSIVYRVHRQTYGWTDWVGNGKPAGTTGEGKRLEGIQIKLTGDIANYYSIKYRVHIQTYGWNQGWQYDGALAGTEGEAKRLESLEIQLVPKHSESMGVAYRVHRQTYGWEPVYKKNGATSGTTGESKRLEGIEIALTGNEYSGDILYKTHVQSFGWKNEVSNGMMSGTSGMAKRLEAISIRLSGEISNYYDVYYRVHAQSYGWLGWAKNGEYAGTSGQSKRLEAIQIVLVKKGNGTPGNIGNVISNQPNPYYKTQAAGCQHNWVDQTKVVHHEAEYSEEKVPITECHWFCNVCGADITALGQTEDQHMMASGTHPINMGTDDDPEWYESYNCAGSHGEYITVGYDTQKTLIKDAWDEVIVTGKKCSKCGATK